METPRPCPSCGRTILVLRIFAEEVHVDAQRRCYRIARDPATRRPLVQEVPGVYAEHECTAQPGRAARVADDQGAG